MAAFKNNKIIIGALAAFGILAAETAGFAGHPMPHPGFRHGPDPLFDLIILGARHLFIRDGMFYRKGPAGYVLVEAPEGAVVASLPRGYGIRVVQGVKYYYFKGIYYVRMPDGYMVVAPPALTAAENKDEFRTVTCKGEVAVTADRLNVRSGPGMTFEVTCLAYKGENLKIYQESGGWIYVELPSGKLGWVDKKFTQGLDQQPVG
ncbi:MAG: SH3 domain-containing protein [Desulfobacterales bacterium]|nr:SH3 domain-containing protein [Desulfobacterales bacterium]